MSDNAFIQLSPGFCVAADFKTALKKLGLTSIQALFDFNAGTSLAKSNLSCFRSRIRIDLPSGQTLFLKRYDHPPMLTQIKNWLSHKKIAATSTYDTQPAAQLAAAGINTPRTIACGSQWGTLFEKRSFVISLKIPGDSLERSLPAFFESASPVDLKKRREFIRSLAIFASRFHATGFRHRDFYLAHIFHDGKQFYLIDLQRAFKPLLLKRRFQVKDLAQLYYSAPGRYFSRYDRMRFFHAYLGKSRIDNSDKNLIKAVLQKVASITRHDRRHNRPIPYET